MILGDPKRPVNVDDAVRTQHAAARAAHPYPPVRPATTNAVVHPDVYVPPEFAELPTVDYAPRSALGPDPNAEGGIFDETKADADAIGDDGFGRDGDVEVGVREVRTPRTPSPTPSEARVLNNKTRMCGDWRRLFDLRRYANRRGIWTLLAVFVVGILVILFLAYQRQIVNWMRPVVKWMHDTPGGWLIPIAIMFVMSFPPLFGQEIVAILCGDVWGVWVGFGIVAAGTILGELGNFYAFRWCCTARGKKLERDRLTYALYAQVTREGGIVVPTVMRLSFIPGHFLTAIFSTCGMNVWVFLVAAVLSLPKQLATVYIGAAQSDGKDTPVTGGIKAVVVLATVAMTYLAMRYINRKVDEVKVRVVYARRKARQARAPDLPPGGSGGSTLPLSPAGDAPDTGAVPLHSLPTSGSTPSRAQPTGSTSKPKPKTKRENKAAPRAILHMPRPQRAISRESVAADTHRPQRLRAFLHGRGADGREAGAGASATSGRDSSGGSGADEDEDADADAWEGKGGVGIRSASARDVEVIELGGRESALRARKHTGDFAVGAGVQAGAVRDR